VEALAFEGCERTFAGGSAGLQACEKSALRGMGL
jgi:hypothetical protein